MQTKQVSYPQSLIIESGIGSDNSVHIINCFIFLGLSNNVNIIITIRSCNFNYFSKDENWRIGIKGEFL